MATIHGEAVKVEIRTDDGWRDISNLANRVEIEPEGVDDGVFLPITDLEIEVIIHDLRQHVDTSDGKVIKVRPRLEM